jgi:hypothetical protein
LRIVTEKSSELLECDYINTNDSHLLIDGLFLQI